MAEVIINEISGLDDVVRHNLRLMTGSGEGAMPCLLLDCTLGKGGYWTDPENEASYSLRAANFYCDENGRIRVFTNETDLYTDLQLGVFRLTYKLKRGISNSNLLVEMFRKDLSSYKASCGLLPFEEPAASILLETAITYNRHFGFREFIPKSPSAKK
jgi:hypothetical protein